MITWQKRSKLTEMKELVVYLKGEKIKKNVENEMLVGVIVNQNVSWEHHINKTNKTVNRLLGLLWRILFI